MQRYALLATTCSSYSTVLLENRLSVYDKDMRDKKRHRQQSEVFIQEHQRNQTLLTDLTFEQLPDGLEKESVKCQEVGPSFVN